jgi:agmatine deiminase
VNMSPGTTRVKFLMRPSGITTDTIWIRDYGPRVVYEGDCRAVVDHAYDIPTRVDDDAFPAYFASVRNIAYYEHPLLHAGGNFHLDSLNRAYATRLVNDENPDFSEADIISLWQLYQNVNTHLFDPYPVSIDLLQHLDMWMQVVANNRVIISDWPNDPGSPQDVICENAATYMASQGYIVNRTAAYSVPVSGIGNVHYTYTNAIICNNLVMVPSYTNQSVGGQNGAAATVFLGALPGRYQARNSSAMAAYSTQSPCMYPPRSAESDPAST